ncbi:MAG: serine/threonine protein kinase [Polyangiales bacterium]|jgi:serine/threonine protein kinase
MLARVESPSLIHVCALASGGMGRVEIAVRREAQFERLFAVKRLHVQYATDAAVRDMFLDEARIAGLIRHPNVVHVVDVGNDEEGPFLVMEYVEGLSLSEVVKHHAARGELIPLSVGLEIMRQVALGLQAAHELSDRDGRLVGLIHRDVSPQNVMVSYDGCARLTDFGIAKASERLTKTNTGVLKGKYGYLSPEQLRFEDPTQASDLFSLGVVLFEVLASRRLYGQGGLGAARQVLNDPPPDLADDRPDVPSNIIGLVFRLLAKDPAHRPASAREVADQLKEALREVEEDEHTELSDYMAARFGEEQKARRTKIANVLKDIDHASHRRAVASHPVAQDRTGRAQRVPRKRFGVYAAGLLALLLSAAGGVYAARDVAGPDVDAPIKMDAEAERSAVRQPAPQPLQLAGEPASESASTIQSPVQMENESVASRPVNASMRRVRTTAMTTGRRWVQEW